MLTKKKVFVYLVGMALLASCGQSGASTDASTPLPTESTVPMVEPSPSPTEEDVGDSKATQTTEACLNAGGGIEELELESEILDRELLFRVYTPPCYTERSEQSFPVLYLIHGQSFTDDQWDRLGADETADELIAAGELPPFLIVMPLDRSSAQPSVDPFGQALMQELIPWIDATYRTMPERESRAIGGLSRGASWALHLALLHPELFGAVGGHSPPVFVEDAPYIRKWLSEIPEELMPRIWLDIGERDQEVILESAKWFAAMLDELNIPHEWQLFTGNHDEAYWRRHMELYLKWYAQDW